MAMPIISDVTLSSVTDKMRAWEQDGSYHIPV